MINTSSANIGSNAKTAAYVQAGGTIVSDLVNLFTGGRAKRKERSFQREMASQAYQRDIDMWHMQNEYNSPQMQMQRLRDANLNPNLVYGQSASGATGAATQMPKYNHYETPVHTPEMSPGFGIANAIMKYQDLRLRDAQIDNLKVQNEVLQAERNIKNTEAFYRSSLLGEKSTSMALKNIHDRNLYNQVFDDDYTNTSFRLSEAFRRHSATTDNILSTTKLHQAQARDIDVRRQLNQLDMNLKKFGGTWQDSLMMRMYLMQGGFNAKQIPFILGDIGKKIKFGLGFGKFNVGKAAQQRRTPRYFNQLQPNYNF